jgi:hypothetical protein
MRKAGRFVTGCLRARYLGRFLGFEHFGAAHVAEGIRVTLIAVVRVIWWERDQTIGLLGCWFGTERTVRRWGHAKTTRQVADVLMGDRVYGGTRPIFRGGLGCVLMTC